MTILSRFSRLVGADLHALLDLVEDPETIVSQGLRDMQADLDRLDGEIARLNALCERAERDQQRLQEDLAAVDGQLDLCLAEGREDLARTLVRRKLDLAHRATAAVTCQEDASRELDRLRDVRRIRGEAFDDLRLRAAAARPGPTTHGVPPAPGDDDVEVALLAELRRRRSS